MACVHITDIFGRQNHHSSRLCVLLSAYIGNVGFPGPSFCEGVASFLSGLYVKM